MLLFSLVECCVLQFAFTDFESQSHYDLFRSILDFKKVRMEDDYARYMCTDGILPKQILLDFADLVEERSAPVHVQHDEVGRVSGACVRTLWRYMLFAGRTNGKKSI